MSQYSTGSGYGSGYLERLRKAGEELIDAKESLEMANSRKVEELADIKNSTCSEIALKLGHDS